MTEDKQADTVKTVLKKIGWTIVILIGAVVISTLFMFIGNAVFSFFFDL